ncbi:MAG: hypothetical protein R3185_02165 [Candidatus Thermoplasmatota archaeon]|nr:hypothetical protein [Candidatus Thermoplasmatota archaeon]
MKTIHITLAALLMLVAVPTGAADTVMVSACWAYEYQEHDHNDESVNVTYATEGDRPLAFQGFQFNETTDAAEALQQDLEDGEAEDDGDGIPDPFDGDGYLAITVYHNDEETADAGTDSAQDDQDVRCPETWQNA